MNSTKIIKLGEKIVNELFLQDGADTLSKWMAHYIAELIEKAKHAEGEEKEKYEKECFEAILKLWGEVYKVPNIDVPLKRFEELEEACGKMFNKNMYRYFPQKNEKDTNEYILLAKYVDSLSKKIVQNSFYLAYINAKEEEKEWFEFDMLDDIKLLNNIEVLFDDVKENEFNIQDEEKQELIDSFENLMKIIDILKK